MRKLLLLLLLIVCFDKLQGQGIIQSFIPSSPFPDKYIEANSYTRQDFFEYNVKKDGTADSTLLESKRFGYDEVGRISEMIAYNSHSFLYEKLDYTYNQRGFIAKIDITNFHEQPSNLRDSQSSIEFTYDTLGHEILNVQNVSLVNTNPFAKAIQKYSHPSEKREYDNKGRLTKLFRRYQGEMKWELAYTLQYDGNDNPELFGIYADTNSKQPDAYYSFITEQDGNIKIYNVTDREGKAYRKYQYNQYQQCTVIVNYIFATNPVEPIASVQKLIYNNDGTINTRISYYDGKLNKMNKYYYYK